MSLFYMNSTDWSTRLTFLSAQTISTTSFSRDNLYFLYMRKKHIKTVVPVEPSKHVYCKHGIFDIEWISYAIGTYLSRHIYKKGYDISAIFPN